MRDLEEEPLGSSELDDVASATRRLSMLAANKSPRQGDNAAVAAGEAGAFRKLTNLSPARRSVRLLPAERAVLERLTRSRTQPHRYVVRSQIVLMAHDGAPVSRIAAATGVARSTVRRWCRRFADGGVRALLTEAPGRGRRPGIDRDTILAVLRAMRQHAGGRLTIRSLASRAHTSASRVWRILDRCGLRASSSRDAIDAAIGRVISETADRR